MSASIANPPLLGAVIDDAMVITPAPAVGQAALPATTSSSTERSNPEFSSHPSTKGGTEATAMAEKVYALNRGVISGARSSKVLVYDCISGVTSRISLILGNDHTLKIVGVRQGSLVEKIKVGQLMFKIPFTDLGDGEGPALTEIPTLVFLMRFLGYYKDLYIMGKAVEAGGTM